MHLEALVEEEAGIDLVTNTVTAVTTEDFASLDMKGILGEALYTLTASLGIDVKDELLQSDDSKRELQACELLSDIMIVYSIYFLTRISMKNIFYSI